MLLTERESLDYKIAVRASNLTFSYDKVTKALDELTIDFPLGATGLLGPNGSGKSTFLKISLGLLVQDQGDVEVLGMNPHLNPLEVRGRIGYVPENDCFIPSLTGLDTCAHFAMVQGLSRSESLQRAHDALDYVELNEARYRPVETYSTGMKQRLKLAQALTHDPSLLFIDEPTNGLDPQGRKDMINLLNQLKRAGKNLILSSHILRDIQEVCDYVVIIDKGKLRTAGNIDEILNSQQNRFIVNTDDNSLLLELVREEGFQVETMGDGRILVYGEEKTVIPTIINLAATYDLALSQLRHYELELEEFFLQSIPGSE